MKTIYSRIKIYVNKNDINKCSMNCTFYEYGAFCKLHMTGLLGAKRCKECIKATKNYAKDIT